MGYAETHTHPRVSKTSCTLQHRPVADFTERKAHLR